MAIPIQKTLARETTATTGTGTVTLGGAATISGISYITFANAGYADGDLVSYGIQDSGNGKTEYGYGTYNTAGPTISRNIIRSSNANALVSLSGTAQIFATAGNAELLWGFDTARNLSLAASVASNALTISIKDWGGSDPSANSPVLIPFRSSTIATGTVTNQPIRAATSLVISSGSTMGASNSTAFRLWIVLFDDGGTERVGAINCTTSSGITSLNEGNVASSTAEGGAGAADSAGIFYTGTAVSSKAYRIIGYMDWASGLSTAGTWASGPTTIQIYGPSIFIPGQTVQVQDTQTGTVATGTTRIPSDNTIPQSGEGDQYMTLAITPTATPNRLIIRAQGQLSGSLIDNMIMALFQDSTANALSSSWANLQANGSWVVIPLEYQMLAATASSTTFKMRAGTSSVGTTTLNGTRGRQFKGATLNSYISITEIMG